MKITNEIDRTKKTGFCDMSGKTYLGKPKKTMVGKTGSTDKADNRGDDEAMIKR